MKKISSMISVAMFVMFGWIASFGQSNESQVPGDNFSLEGALELFKKSASPEEFEKLLNAQDSKVNNLDLDGDGYIDYIRVIDRQEGNVHAFVLQAVVSEKESQDVAVIELEKKANGKAVLQIIGDEDVFGVETIIEPTQEVRTYAGAQTSPVVVNVWAWPSVSYIYGPYYSGWSSPWGWHLRPVWWHSWRPIAYVRYYSIWDPYRPYYSYCHTRRIVYARDIYRPYRTTSVVYYNRHRDQVVTYRSSHPDGYRSGRMRNDGRGLYADQNSRSRTVENERRGSDSRKITVRPTTSNSDLQRKDDVDRNGRSSTQRPVVRTTSPTSSERNVPADIKRSSTEVNRKEVTRKIEPTVGIVHDTPAATRQVTRSAAVERRSSSISPQEHERSAMPVRSVPAESNRNAAVVPGRSSAPVHQNREVTPQASRPATSVNRSRSSVGANVQRSSSVQRSPSRPDAKSNNARRGRN